MTATVTITRRESGLTYQILDPYHSGIAEITVDALRELFEMAGIKPEGQQ